MKTVLAFGDSLTWGFDGPTRTRHPFEKRWPNVLQAELGSDYHVIAEGLNGRTTGYDDHLADCDRNGAQILPTLLHSHSPLDLVILFLGVNDLKPFTGAGARGAAMGMARLVELVRHHAWPSNENSGSPEIIIVSPPPIQKPDDPDYGDTFADAIEDSKSFARRYADLARDRGCGFFDAGTIVTTDPHDGIHLDAGSTAALGRALAPVVREQLQDRQG
ncbi:SGNH/GDSL hydrolase family protein [Notoacmeibacter sp. MSK16QG-6]|uniref:SGNH/GDSL hydrolase family protein n=1 Tax=Notoacmeibacter sp. MSK16QG-6 TaxID=2957982 RepID=UPI00209EA33B|nr:SGNH/GDSL hydrolase family protein [Notoacmeibacter sp. MSK16QG-6]MCP1200767.1 SGNH/GDSL hydrolase family protein [Notoacmeibacter sp. MSK16QG-6]